MGNPKTRRFWDGIGLFFPRSNVDSKTETGNWFKGFTPSKSRTVNWGSPFFLLRTEKIYGHDETTNR